MTNKALLYAVQETAKALRKAAGGYVQRSPVCVWSRLTLRRRQTARVSAAITNQGTLV